MNLSFDSAPAPLPVISQESLSLLDDIASLELLRFTSSTVSKLFLDSDDLKDPTKKPSNDDNPTDTPTKFDVLLGKEKESLNHVGNKSYLAMVALNRNEYQSRKTRAAKSKITTRLIHEIYARGGRFVKKNTETGEYDEVSHEVAHEKVSKALRAKGPSAKMAPRKKRKVVRKPPTPQENKAFDFMFVEQQRIFQGLLAEQYAV